jgi:hypothetical protein
MKYTIYTKKRLLNESINSRGEGKVFTLFFTVQGLSFGVIYRPYYFGSLSPSHFSFHALSKGFEEFTESGYRSMFVQRLGVASCVEIEEYLLKELKASIPFLKSEKNSLQLSLF